MPTIPTAYNNHIWTMRNKLLVALSVLIAVVYLSVIWTSTANTPDADDPIHLILNILFFLDANTLLAKLDSALWTYSQHRGILSRAIFLPFYYAYGHIDIHALCALGNVWLCLSVLLLALNIHQRGLPIYTIAIASLMMLSFYPWNAAVIPIASLGYYSTMLVAFSCFFLLDQSKPNVFLAALLSWIATFNMANGLLSVVIGSLILICNQYNENKYSSRQITLWFISVIGCFAVYFSTTNVFSTELYGAKSWEQSFVGLSGRALDFLESMGAAPFFPDENRPGKITLGCIFLSLIALLATSRQSMKYPAIVGMGLFTFGTLFLTSLFRYSAGSNNGYQIFTATNMAIAFVIGAAHIDHQKHRFIAPLMLLAAVAFNLNALIGNYDKITAYRDHLSTDLENLLITDKPNSTTWRDVIINDGISRKIYRPLQSHQTLKIPAAVERLDKCPEYNTTAEGTIEAISAPSSFAIKMLATTSHQTTTEDLAIFLCGKKNYRLPLRKRNISTIDNKLNLEVLLDKSEYDISIYQVYLQTGHSIIKLDGSLDIQAIIPRDRKAEDCKAIKTFSFFKSFKPMITRYCWRG